MEGLREVADSSNHAVDRRQFLALSAIAVAGLLRGVCAAEEKAAEPEADTEEKKPSAEKLTTAESGKSGESEAKEVSRKKPTEEEIRLAMNRIAQATLEDFREGIEIAGVIIRVPDEKPWGTIVAGDKTWMLRAKDRAAKVFVTRGCTIGDMSWDGEAGELTTVLHPDGPLLPKRKRKSTKVHPFDKTVAMMYALCCDDKDLLLSEADGRPTGMVLTLDPPEPPKEEEAEEEEKKDE